MTTVDTKIDKAMPRAQAALAERARLLAFGKELEGRRQAATDALPLASAARAEADAQSVIAPAADRAGWIKRADTEGTKITDAQREIERVTGALTHLPAMLAKADDEILAAHQAISAIAVERSGAARIHIAGQLRDVAAQLGKILLQAHALTACGVHMGDLIAETKVLNPAGNWPFIVGGTMTLDDERIYLQKVWRDDPAAVALFDAHSYYAALRTQFKSHLYRIEEARQRAVVAANEAGRSRSFTHPQPQHAAPRPAYEPPKSTFVPNADTHTAPPNTTVQDATIRVDVTSDTTESLSPAQMDAIWAQASGDLPRPAPDALFQDFANRMPASWMKEFIGYEGRQAKLKARRALAHGAAEQHPGSHTLAAPGETVAGHPIPDSGASAETGTAS